MYELLRNSPWRRAYDDLYNDILRALEQVRAEERDLRTEERVRAEERRRCIDRKSSVVWNLKPDQPRAAKNGLPARDHCTIVLDDLPPQTTVVDLVRAIARIGPVGRVIHSKMMPPLDPRASRTGMIEFANDDSAQRLGVLAFSKRFHLFGKPVWNYKLMPLLRNDLRPPPADATRVLVIDGPKDHKLMTSSALRKFFGRKVKGASATNDSHRVMDSTNAPNRVTIIWAFTTWRGGAYFARAALRRQYPELTVTFAEDPCE